jgi:hypothetical protein
MRQGQYETLDDVPVEDIRRQSVPMFRTFFACVVVALVFGLAVAAATVLQVVFEPLWWTLYLRAIAFLRTAILVFMVLRMCMCASVSVVHMYGTGGAGQATVAVSIMPTLWTWRILGPLDLVVGRLVPLVADGVSLATHPDLPVAHALIRMAIGVGLIIEYYTSLWLVHKRGIWNNVASKLRLIHGRRRKVMLSPRHKKQQFGH